MRWKMFWGVNCHEQLCLKEMLGSASTHAFSIKNTKESKQVILLYIIEWGNKTDFQTII